MRRILITLALLMVAALGAQADESRFVTYPSDAALKTILTEEGYTILNKEGTLSPTYMVSTADNMIFYVTYRYDSGNYTGSHGIDMWMKFEANGKVTLEAINQANLIWETTTAKYYPNFSGVGDEIVYIGRFVILGEGVSFAYVKENIEKMLNIAPLAADLIFKQGEYAP